MNPDLDLEGARCDEESARLLPWYVAGRLSPADFERVSSHLEHCAICRADLEHERAVRQLMKADTPVEFAPQTGLAKTLLRIDELSHDASDSVVPRRTPSAAGRRRAGALQWLTAAVILQTVALGWLGASMRHRPASGANDAPYETLSAVRLPTSPGPHIRVLFAPTMTLAELKSLLAVNALTIIRGPSDVGAYTLAPLDQHLTGALLVPVISALRGDARVLFVEYAVNDGAMLH